MLIKALLEATASLLLTPPFNVDNSILPNKANDSNLPGELIKTLTLSPTFESLPKSNLW